MEECEKEIELSKTANDVIENRDANMKNLLIKEVSDNLVSKVATCRWVINEQELQVFLNNLIEIIKQEEALIDNTTIGKPYKQSSTFKRSRLCYYFVNG